MTFNLREDALSRTLIAAHRGVSGGNIPGNTPASFDAALIQGADMIELDVSISADGQLYVFHPGMEFAFLRSNRLLRDMTSAEIAELRFHNADGTPTDQKICTFDEILDYLKGRCYINVDKYFDNPAAITKALKRHNMMDQILVKSKYSEEVFRTLEELAPELNYMAILKETDFTESESLLRRKLNYVGAEVLFTTDDAPVTHPHYFDFMRRNGLLVWANSIVYNYKDVLAAGHNDDISVVGRMDEGWGWLLKKGFNIIQTDWPLMLRMYMDGKYPL